jgi:hypothetical protein
MSGEQSAPDGAVEAMGQPSGKTIGRDVRRRPWSVLVLSDVLVAGSLVLYALAIKTIPADRLGQYGLVPALPTLVLVAVGLLVIAIAIAVGSSSLVANRLRAYLLVLIFFLYGTAGLVYREGRYNWLYKTVGVVQYVNAHGALDRHIDIYQNWPGFFALAAWFDKVAGVSSPLAYAKWAQLGFELLSITVLFFALKALPLTERERWTALFLYAATNWIAQDYFSPQALGVVLSLGTLGITLHWLVGADEANKFGRMVGRAGRRLRFGTRSNSQREAPSRSRADVAGAMVALFLVFFVLVFVHELSPYIVLAQLGALALIGWLRPGWTVFGLAAIAVGYLVPRFSFVNQHFGLLASVGNFFSNVAPPSTYVGQLSAGARLDQLCADALSVGMWLLGLLGVYLRWRRGRPVLTLALLAGMPAAVLIAQPYGGEAILRVYLFSLPWTAALAASAVWELLSVVTWRRVMELAALLACCLALFSEAFFGDDQLYVMPTTEVKALVAFYREAVPGPVYQLNDNFPGLLTARYNQFPQSYLTGPYGVMKNRSILPDSGDVVAQALRRAGATYGHPAYVVLAPSVELYGSALGLDRPGEYADLRQSLLADHEWTPVVDHDGILIAELPAST